MDNPRKGRVEERHFLNLPGSHAGAYVLAYVQDTSDREVRLPTAEHPNGGYAPDPRMTLEISDCTDRIRLEFDLEDAEDRLNSFHKINTLIATLEAFRAGMEAEAALRRRRLREIETAREVVVSGIRARAHARRGTPAASGGLRAVSS